MKFNIKVSTKNKFLLFLGLFFIIGLMTISNVKANFFQPEFPEAIFNLFGSLFTNYLITVFIELLIILMFFKKSKKLALTVLWINFITNPPLNLFIWTFDLLGIFLVVILTIIIGESFSIYLESILLIEKLDSLEINATNRKVYSVIFLANIFSVGVAIFPIMIAPPIYI
jgi:hypothetical protein